MYVIVLCRYLATGESYRSLAFQFRLGKSTLTTLIPEVCEAIWEALQPIYMRMPRTSRDWMLIASNFMYKWQYPNCLGAIDGKHVVILKPDNTGSLYYNYKGSMSVVLMAVADAYLQFKYIDVGSYGRTNDAGIFSTTSLCESLENGTLGIPPPGPIPNAVQYGNVPYNFIGDEAFPLLQNLMRPYSGRGISRDRRAFNYRLSRARRIIECSFGVLANRWRIFHTKIAVCPDSVRSIVKATCVLHNMLQAASTPAEITALTLQEYDEETEALQQLQHNGYRGANDALNKRDVLKLYFNTYKLAHQDNYIDRGLH